MSETKHNVRVWLFMLLAVVMIGFSANTASAATNMVSSAKKNTYKSGSIVEDRYGYRFKDENGKFVRNKWIRFNGQIYSLKSNGYANRGWFQYKGQTYYANEKGQLSYSKFLTVNGRTYYMHSSGKRLKNTWLKLGKTYYRLNKNGELIRSSMFSVSKKWYYADSNGVILKNKWVTLSTGKYCFDKNGVRIQKKWVKSDGKYYYLQANGKMAVNCRIGSYSVGADGARITATSTAAVTSSASGASGAHYLFVGDSRTVGMDAVVSNAKTSFVAKISMGYDWMVSAADASVKQYLAKYPTATVVYAFGVNDIGNIDKYIAYYKNMMAMYPKANFRFMSVNPINEKKYKQHYRGTLSNAMIRGFNTKLQAAVGAKYVNSYAYLMKNNPVMVDGLHYDGASNLRVYNYVMSQIG